MDQHHIHFAIIVVLILVVFYLYKKYTTCTFDRTNVDAKCNIETAKYQEAVNNYHKMYVDESNKYNTSLETVTKLNQQINDQQNKISLLEGSVKSLETNLDDIQVIFKNMIKTVNNNKNVVKNMSCSTESKPVVSEVVHSDSACWDLCTGNKDCSYATYNGDKCNVYSSKPINCSPLQGMVMYVRSLLN